jgi:hypothetical protein
MKLNRTVMLLLLGVLLPGSMRIIPTHPKARRR